MSLNNVALGSPPSVPNPESQPGYGLGRPINRVWLESFSQKFDNITPDELSLVMPMLPGIVYERPGEVAKELGEPSPNIKQAEMFCMGYQ